MSPPQLSFEDREKIIVAKTYILNNLKTELRVAAIAEEAGLSMYQLKSGFQKLFGMTVKKYIFDSKMRVALFLLQTGGKSVKETAILCGYKKYHNFSRAFKNHYQTSPKQIKDQAADDDMFFMHS